MQLVPYVYDDEVGDYVLGEYAYDISAVIGDSIVLEQSEGEAETKMNEFSPTPVIENVTPGKYSFSAQILDLQNSILKAVFGALTATEEIGGHIYDLSAMGDGNETKQALVRVCFKDNNSPDVYLPKVSLDSQLLINQLKTHGSQGNLKGTALVQNCAVISNQTSGKLVEFTSPTGEKMYMVRTSVLFVPKGYTPVFQYNNPVDDEYVFSQLDWNATQSSVVAHNVEVEDINTGLYTITT